MSDTVKPPTSRQKSAARLYAVQAVYQMLMSGQGANIVTADFFENRLQPPFEPGQEGIEKPDGNLFRRVVEGVSGHRDMLGDVIGQTARGGLTTEGLAEKEPLLLAILLCGGFELMAHLDIDPPIIISDYLNISHAYYEGSESSIINGILDKLKDLYRPK